MPETRDPPRGSVCPPVGPRRRVRSRLSCQMPSVARPDCRAESAFIRARVVYVVGVQGCTSFCTLFKRSTTAIILWSCAVAGHSAGRWPLPNGSFFLFSRIRVSAVSAVLHHHNTMGTEKVWYRSKLCSLAVLTSRRSTSLLRCGSTVASSRCGLPFKKGRCF